MVLEACLAATRAAGAGSDQEESSRASERGDGEGRGGEDETKRNEAVRSEAGGRVREFHSFLHSVILSFFRQSRRPPPRPPQHPRPRHNRESTLTLHLYPHPRPPPPPARRRGQSHLGLHCCKYYFHGTSLKSESSSPRSVRLAAPQRASRTWRGSVACRCEDI